MIFGVEGLAPPSTAGVVTQGAGDIQMYAKAHPAESRVMTTFGGHIMGWSAEGDINSGRAPRARWSIRRSVGCTTPWVMSACRRRCPAPAPASALDPIPEVPRATSTWSRRWARWTGEAGIRVGQHQHRRAARGQCRQHPGPGRIQGHPGDGDGEHRRADLGQLGRVVGHAKRSGDDAATAGIRAPEPAVHHLGADPGLRQRAGIWIVREGAAPGRQPPRRDARQRRPAQRLPDAGQRRHPGAQRAGSRTPNGAGCREAEAGVVPVTRRHTPTLPVHRSPSGPPDPGMGGRLRGRRVALRRPGRKRTTRAWGYVFGVRRRPLHAHAIMARARWPALLLLAACCWLAGRGAARASAHFASIPPSRCRAALEQYSNVTGGSVVYRAALTVGRRSAAVKESIRRRLPCAC